MTPLFLCWLLVSTRWPFVGRTDELGQIGAAMRDSAGMVLVGSAGVGKTRLAFEAVTGVDPGRCLGLWVAATSVTKSIPFGALAPVLSVALPETPNPVELLRHAGASLVERAGTRRLVLGIDDAHLLDDMSAALVHQLAQSGQAFVLTTVRTGEPVPDPISALWKEEMAARLEIEALSWPDVQQVLATVLGGQVDGATSRRMWDATHGNMLLLRELVNAGKDNGALAETAGVWRWDGPWVVAPRLVELITGRVGRLEPAEQEVLEVVAYGEPLGATLLTGLTDQRTVLTLESKGLLWVHQDGRRVDVRLCHPLYGEVLRANTSRLRARIVRQSLADAVEETGARRRDDWLRIATWRLDASAPVRPAVLAAAGLQAFAALDLPLAERLARGAFEAGEDLASGEVLWRVLFLTGRAKEAEDVLTRLFGLPMSDDQRGGWAVGRAYNLFWGLQQVDDAYAVLRETREVINDRVWQDELDLLRCVFDMLRGRPAQALDDVAEVRARPELSPRVTAQTMLVQGMAGTHLGKLAEAAQALDGMAELAAHCTDIPWVFESRGMYRSYVELFSGRLHEASDIAADFYAHAVETNWEFPLGLSCGVQAQVARLRGRVQTAAKWAREGRRILSKHLFPIFQSYVVGETAHCEALAGRAAAASAALAEADRTMSPAEMLLQPWTELGRPWVAVVNGDIARAAELALDAAGFARSQEALGFEAFALHDAARLGAAHAVADRLGELASVSEGEFVPALAEHAAAVVTGDTGALEAAGRRFAQLGADLLAAEAYIQASRSGRGAGADRLRAQAMLLLTECEGASTPIVAEISQARPTRRQRHIARLAAAGLSNQDIAEQLFVSVRTVENHLYRIYARLGISDRSGLAGMVTSDDGPVTG